uniref:Uncharacterized protein n=1 Tax=Rhizophora mucronata TaxID=61149 RepID=A0A2P2IHG9_RHIMU
MNSLLNNQSNITKAKIILSMNTLRDKLCPTTTDKENKNLLLKKTS